MLHYIYAGHFEHEGNHIRYTRRESRWDASRPVISRSIRPDIVSALQIDGFNSGRGELLPPHWEDQISDGFLSWDRHELTAEDVAFIEKLVKSGACEIFDSSNGQFLTTDELWQCVRRVE